MSADRPDLPIDLHKLAAQNGEGLAPELFALFDRSRIAAYDAENVLEFPARDLPSPRHRSDAGSSDRDNVVAFRPVTGKTSGR